MSTASARAASYVLTLEEIGHLAAEGGKPAETLMNVVALIAGRFQTDVCSAYLLEPDRANLVLAATLGLRPSCIGTLRMALNEGFISPKKIAADQEFAGLHGLPAFEQLIAEQKAQ